MEEITPEILSEICGFVRIGSTFEVACLAAGFKTEQIKEMLLLLSTAENGIWKEFADDVKKALAQAEIMALMKISAEGGAKGAQWLLERSNPGKWEKASRKGKPRKIQADEKEEAPKLLEIPEWSWDD